MSSRYFVLGFECCGMVIWNYASGFEVVFVAGFLKLFSTSS
jgi:hypothetical protein